MKTTGRTWAPACLILLLAACGGGGGGGDPAPPPRTLSTVAVAPSPFATGVGIARPLHATGTYSDNTTADLTASVQWSTTDANIVTVSAGVITGVAPGTATIRATSGSTTGQAVVTVSANTWSPAASLKIRRQQHTATLLPTSGKVLDVAGSVEIVMMSGETYASAIERSKLFEVEIYDPSLDSWSFAASLKTARARHTATLLPNGKLLVTGGDAVGTSVELYDPGANTWATGAPMGTARSAHTAVLLANGKVLVFGGAGTSLSTEIYDPALNTWTSAAPMEIAHNTNPFLSARLAAVLLSDGRVLVAGSTDPAPAASAEIYDPATNAWSSVANMIENRAGSAGALLKDGRVLFASGYRAGVPDASVAIDGQIYDSTTGSWALTTVDSWKHAETSAVTLPNGRVLVAGGYGGFGNRGPDPTRNSLYDPVTDVWTAAGMSEFGRVDHTVTLLLNGAVLIAGGTAVPNSDGSALAACELYW